MTQTEPSNPEDSIRVLHVDDEQSQLKFTKSFINLSDSAIHMDSVLTPEAALRRLEEENFDCVVSDYQMPVLNGIELAIRIRDFSDIPIIIYTGRGSEEVASKAFAAGIDDYMRKELEPSHYEVLARRIRAAVEKHLYERRLGESVNQFRVLFDGIPDAILLIDPNDYTIIRANKAAFEHPWKEEVDVIGRPCYEITHQRSSPCEPPEYPCPIRELLETGMSTTEVHLHHDRDGNELYYEVSAFPILDDEGRIVNVVHCSRDITERKQAETELENSERKFRQFFENEPDYCYMVSTDGEILDINRSALKTLGYEKDEVLGKPLLTTIYAPSSRDKAQGLFEKWRETGDLSDEELQIITKGGEERRVLLSVAAVKDSEGKILHSISTQTDITERKRMEEELKESESHFRALFDNMVDGFAFHRIVQNEEGEPVDYVFLDANDAFERLTGLKIPEILGKTVTEVLPGIEDDPADWIGRYGQIALSGGVSKFEQYAQPLKRWYSVTAYSPKKGFFATIFEDITDRKNYEKKLTALHEQAIQLNKAEDLDEVWESILEAAGTILGFDYFGILIKEEGKLREIKSRGLPVIDFTLPLSGKGLIVKAANEKTTVLVNDTRGNPDFVQGSLDTKSEMVVPVVVDADVYAVFNVESEKLNAFSENDQKLLETLAMHTASTIESMRRMDIIQISEARYRNLIEEGMDAVVITIEQEFAYVNKTFVEMLGYADPSELIGRRSGELVDPRDHERLEEITERRKRGEYQRIIYNLRILKKDGSSIWLEVSSIGTEFEGKRASISNSRDITDRIRMEEDLRIIRERLQAFMDSAPVNFAIFDSELNYVDVNQNAVKLFGLSREELIGRNMREVHPVTGESGRDESYREVIRTGEPLFLPEARDPRVHGDRVFSIWGFKVGEGLGLVSMDVTDRRRMEEELRKSEGQLRLILESGMDGVSIVADDKLVYMNDRFCELLGYDGPEELLGLESMEIVHPSSRGLLREKQRNRDQGDTEPAQYELEMLRRDGSTYTAETLTSVIEYEGKPARLGFNRNITERKKRETELQDSEDRWRSLVELAPDGIMTVDLKGFITSINDAFVKLTGFSREEIVGKHFTRLGTMRARDIPIYVKLFTSLLKGDTPPKYEFIYRRKDGSERWAEAQFRLIETAEKKKELLAVVSDVSERKRMEEELRKHSEHLEELVQEKTMELSVSEERLRSFMAAAPDAFTLYDSELNLLDVNQALLKYWPEGTRKEDIIGKNILDLSPYIKETGRYDRYIEVIKTGKPFQIEDPTAHPFLGDARLFLRAFKVGEGLGIISTDITDQKRMEEELVEAERMSAMGRVSAMVGHDLRGPLQTIMNALYIMEKTPEQTGELREKIEESVNYATRILDDLRYSTGDIPVHLQESSVGVLLQKTIANSSMPDNIRVDLDVGEGLTSVRLDPLMAQRVLDNLVRNSVEAMADGGVLSLTAYKEPDEVVIKVSDTGKGIPEEDLKQLYTLFFTSKPGGMGLGLAYCKRAVEAHGGTIEVESEVGRGTIFTVRIPMNQA